MYTFIFVYIPRKQTFMDMYSCFSHLKKLVAKHLIGGYQFQKLKYYFLF